MDGLQHIIFSGQQYTEILNIARCFLCIPKYPENIVKLRSVSLTGKYLLHLHTIHKPIRLHQIQHHITVQCTVLHIVMGRSFLML